MTIVIADAGPLIALSRIDKLDLLQQIFQQVTITNTVRDEVLENKHCKGKTAVVEAINASWISVQNIDMAKMQDYILSAKDVLYALRDEGYYMGDAIIEVVLRDMGE